MTDIFKPDMLAGKSALISGGTSGINLEIAKTFTRYGAKVTVFGRDPEKAARAAAEIGGGAKGLSADVRDYSAVKAVAEEAAAITGTLDIVLAGAAGNFPAPAIDISANGFKAVVDIDLLGTYNIFHSAFPHLTKPGASLIAITAGQGSVPMPFQAHVCAAKAGINMLIKCLALEWGPAGIRVNGISPGPIAETEGMARLAPTKEIEDAYLKKVALRRMGTKQEIGALAAYLCSDAAGYMSGSIHNCDGASELGDASMDALTSWKG